MGNFLSFLKKGNSEPQSSLLAPLTTKPLQSLQHKEPPRIKFSKDRTPFITLLEIQPDLLRFVFSFLRSEDIYRMRALNHYMYYLISNHVDLYFMNQVMLPRILQQLACKRVKSVKVVSQHDHLDTTHTKKWLCLNKNLEDLELVGFQFFERPDELRSFIKCLPELNYLALNDRNCFYDSEIFDALKMIRVKHLCLKNRQQERQPSPKSVCNINPNEMPALTELSLHGLIVDKITASHLLTWIRNSSSTLEGLHLLRIKFADALAPMELQQALSQARSLKRFTATLDSFPRNFLAENPFTPNNMMNSLLSPTSSIERLKFYEDGHGRDAPNRMILAHLCQMPSLQWFGWSGSLYGDTCPITQDSRLKCIEVDQAYGFPISFFNDIVCGDSQLSRVKLRKVCSGDASGAIFKNQALTLLTMYNMEGGLTYHLQSIADAAFTPNIQYLDVSFSKMDCRVLAAAVRKCQNLVRFSMACCFKRITVLHSNMGELFDAIRESPSLRDLNISGNAIPNETFDGLHQILKNQQLEHVKMNLTAPMQAYDHMSEFSILLRKWRASIDSHPNLTYISCCAFGGFIHFTEHQEALENVLLDPQGKNARCTIVIE